MEHVYSMSFDDPICIGFWDIAWKKQMNKRTNILTHQKILPMRMRQRGQQELYSLQFHILLSKLKAFHVHIGCERASVAFRSTLLNLQRAETVRQCHVRQCAQSGNVQRCSFSAPLLYEKREVAFTLTRLHAFERVLSK